MNITLLRCLAFLLLVLCLPVSAKANHSGDFGHGIVRMQGSIITTACAIDTKSRDQTIDMSVLPINQLVNNGRSHSHPFSITLVNCVLGREDWQRFQVAFYGPTDDGLFSVQGRARGIALQIVDTAGNIAMPGIPLPAMEFIEDNRRLHYALRLVGNSKKLQVGDYSSTLRFEMSYY